MAQPQQAAQLGQSRSKRSTTNLSNLRLAPLSTRFDPPADKSDQSAKSPYSETRDYTRQHSSYLQGKSAPTTPGILSRSSSRRHLSGGVSRRGSLYDNEGVTYEYTVAMQGTSERAEVGSGQIPKAKSEAVLSFQQQQQRRQQLQQLAMTTQGEGTKTRHHRRSGTGGGITPRIKSRSNLAEDDFLTRTGATANALLQESKGRSWMTSKGSSTSLVGAADTTDDDEDEGYEEMAALSSIANRRKSTPGEMSPVGTRTSQWGSKYGSRAASRRTSRRGSMTSVRTPLAAPGGLEPMTGYFEAHPSAIEPDAEVDEDFEDESADEKELVRLASDQDSRGLTGFMSRLMKSTLFNVNEERDDSSNEGDVAQKGETEAEAKARMATILRRRKEEKDRLVALARHGNQEESDEQNEFGWQHDAAWLLSVAARALFSDSTHG